MPVAISRLFGPRSLRMTADATWGLRILASLQRPGEQRPALEAACRLLRRGPCDVALVCAKPESGPVRVLVGGGRGQVGAAIAEALNAAGNPLSGLDGAPRFGRLAEQPFGPGATFQRRFQQAWVFAVPFTADLGAGRSAHVFLASGRQEEVDRHHPLIRAMELVWRAAADLPTPSPWPGADGWETLPAALAVVGRDQVLAANARLREMLAANVGRDGTDWRPWLLGAVRRLLDDGTSPQTLPASAARRRSLNVVLGPYLRHAGGWLVALSEAAASPGGASQLDEQASALGHELRTPLTAMSTAMALVTRGDAGPVTPDQARFLGMCQRNLERLDRLVNDLLDSRRAAAGSLALNLALVDLGAHLTDSCELFAIACREKGVILEAAAVPASFPACVDVDKVLQMVHNITSNALKYTPRGGRVRVSLVPHGRQLPGLGARLARHFVLPLDVISLVVEDTGLGMSEALVGRLFKPFCRDEGTQTQAVPGAGLGLYITRGLAEAMGGDIRVVSRAGAGTTVWLAIPRQADGGRVLAAGRELESLHDAARAAGLAPQLVALDLRRNPPPTAELVAAMARGRDFLARLARERAAAGAADLLATGPALAHEIAPGLLVGLALDPDRIAAAWEVAVSAPHSGASLAGRRWEPVAFVDEHDKEHEPCPVG